MLRQETIARLPNDFQYTNTDWYHDIKKRHDAYRFKLIRDLFIATSLIPLIFAMMDTVGGTTAFLINYAISFFALILLLAIMLKTRKTDLFAAITIALCFIGLILTLYLPNSRNVNLIIFFGFPPIAFQLFGTRKGAILILSFLIIVVSIFTLLNLGLIPPLNARYPYKLNVILGFVAFFIVSLITYYGELQNEKEIDLICRNILFDDLTGMPGKNVLIHSIRRNTNYIFAIIHMENFKELGLMFGYHLSDKIILFLSNQLKRWEQECNYSIFKLTGIEFGILIPLKDNKKEEAYSKLVDIGHLLQSTPMPWENIEMRLNIRIGGTAFHSDDLAETTDFLSKADMALKSSIDNHRGVTLFTGNDHLKISTLDSIKLFSILYKNYEKKTYKAYFQPIVHAATSDVVWYESLLRIQNPQGDYDSPLKYLSIAESTGLDSDITQFMIGEAYRALKLTEKNISVNITFRNMVQSKLIEQLILNHQDPQPRKGKLILEILERAELIDIEACKAFIKTAHELGCLIAIDDFGSGYSNFENILRLQADIIKINGSLVKQWHHNPKATKMIKSIITLCKQMDLLIVAEWVEYQQLADDLIDAGVDFLQGYHFGRPKEASWR